MSTEFSFNKELYFLVKQKSECMKHVVQKVFFLSVLVIPTLLYASEMNKLSENDVDSGSDEAHTALNDRSLRDRSFEAVGDDDSLPRLFRGELAVGGTGTFTLDTSGVYVLTGQKSAHDTVNIAITASDVVLDLDGNALTGGTNGIEISGNNVMVKNGTITGATQSGIKITGDNCLLKNITAIGNVTGFELNGSENTTVRSCRALNNTREGFLLANAQNNSFEQCEALNTRGAGTVAGFKTTGGTGNSFVECTINGVASSNADAYGVLGLHETQARISSSSVMNIAGSAYTAGIGLIGDYLGTPTAQSFVSSFTGRSSFSVDWLNTPDGSYIASANNSATNVNAKVDTFSATSNLADFGYTGTIVQSLQAVSWLNWNNAYYLAIGGNGGVGTTYPDVKVFSCALSNALSLTAEVGTFTNPTDGTVFDLEWFFSGTTPYLAYAGSFAFTQEVGVLQFTGNSLHHVAGSETGSTMRAVKVHTYKGHIRLALAVQRTDGVWIYGFDEPQGSQTLVVKTRSPTVPNVPTYLSWLDYDGKTYLAVAFENNVANNVRVFEYTEEPSALLTEFSTYSYGAATRGLDWLVTGTTVYLAVSGDNTSKRTLIMKFDPYQGSTTTRLSDYYNLGDTQVGYRLRWYRR
jgi:parallel beta-helix repeat protein